MHLRSTLLGGSVALGLIAAAALVPADWTEQLGITSLLGASAGPPGVFAQEVAQFDAWLSGAPGSTRPDVENAPSLVPHVQLRRVLRSGPMTSDEVRQATVLLEEFWQMERGQASQGSRQAVREERIRALAARHARLDAGRLAKELGALQSELERASLGLYPESAQATR